MKTLFFIIVSMLIMFASYFLYQKSLGAIPFLIASFVLFYLGRKSLKQDSNE